MKRKLCIVSLLCFVSLIWSANESLGHDEGWDVESLIEQLGDADGSAREAASIKLEQAGPRAKAAVPALIRALSDENEQVRFHAANALGWIGDSESLCALTEALSDENSWVRVAVARALANIDKSKADMAIPVLIQILVDEKASSHAADVLGRMGQPAKAAVPALIRTLNDKKTHWQVRYHVAMALANIDKSKADMAIPILIQALGDERVWTGLREMIAEVLGPMGQPAKAAVPALIEALGDKYWSTRYDIVAALGQIGDPAAVPALIRALSDENWAVRYNAANALGDIGDPVALPALTEALSDENRTVRVWANYAVYRLDNSKRGVVFPALIEALSDENEIVRRNTAKALKKIGTPEATKAVEEYEKKR